jgi:N-acetylmuramoyl-L-alanine amidase
MPMPLAEGEAVGATIYTLSDDASDAAPAALAERHDRDDLLSGVDLTEQDDLVANVLMDMARTETSRASTGLPGLAAIPRWRPKAEDAPVSYSIGGVFGAEIPGYPLGPDRIGLLSSASDLERPDDDWLAPKWRWRSARPCGLGAGGCRAFGAAEELGQGRARDRRHDAACAPLTPSF